MEQTEFSIIITLVGSSLKQISSLKEIWGTYILHSLIANNIQVLEKHLKLMKQLQALST